MKKFQLNKEASDGNCYAIQEILVKEEKLEEIKKKIADDASSSTFPIYYNSKILFKDKILRKKIKLTPAQIQGFRILRDMAFHEMATLRRLENGMRTIFISTIKCNDINEASFIIRSGPKKKDALVCPWCIKEQRDNYRDCFKLTPFWLLDTIFKKIKTAQGLRFLYIYRCKYNNKLFIVERPDSRLLEPEFYNRCPYCEAKSDNLSKIDFFNMNTIYCCATCKLVFSVGANPKSNIWEIEQSNRIKRSFPSKVLEKKLYDFRPLDSEYYYK